MRIACTLFVFLSLLLAAAGCGDGLRRAAVKGEILIDKVPLEEGSIEFFPVDDNAGPSVGTDVRNGQYSIAIDKGVIVGKNRVVIRGFRKSGKKITDIWKKDLVDELVPAVPPEFNDQSQEFRDITTGVNTINFDLPGIKK